MRYSKVSEYRFERVLKRFCNFAGVDELADRSKISSRAVRDIYWRLRFAILESLTKEPQLFGGAAEFLLDGEQFSSGGKVLVHCLSYSDANPAMHRHIAPSLGQLTSKRSNAMKCEIVLRAYNWCFNRPELICPQPKQVTNRHPHLVGKWWEGCFPFEVEHRRIEVGLIYLEEEMRRISKSHNEYREPNRILFNDLRGYLIRNPL